MMTSLRSTEASVTRPESTSTPDAAEITRVREIDLSVRLPVIIFITAGIFWLLLGPAFGIVAALKMHAPGFLGQWEWLTFGRVRSAHLNMAIYGWASCAAIAVGLWIMARLSATKLRHGGILTTAAVFWNLGVAIGVIGIFAGDMNPVAWLEMPMYAVPLLFIAYVLIGLWGVLTFWGRRTRHIYVSQWYLLGAFFWFAWIYSVAQGMLLYEPTRGTVQSIVNYWYVHNAFFLWLAPVGLAAAYYLIPKVTGKRIYNYYLSTLGFWSFAFIAAWGGMQYLIGSPVPVWVVSSGAVASMLMIIPVTVIGINHYGTLAGSFGLVRTSPALKFIVFGVVAFTVTALLSILLGFRTVGEVTHFTHFRIAHTHLGVYGFFSMMMFGAIYYLVPRIVNRPWPSPKWIQAHFWLSAAGISIYFFGLGIGGLIQGFQMNDPSVEFIEVVRGTIPYLFIRSFGGTLMFLGHIAFAASLISIFRSGASEKNFLSDDS
ncbi:MAG: cbb3-type cytochrome c oxidase subunit I [Opitutales bacterium]